LVKKHLRLTAIKERIRLECQQKLQTKVMVTLFGLCAEIERELISMRTKEALAAALAAGKCRGRPQS
jgi:DNA invertase Pin-like site-specific DNA recombinase